MYATLKECIYRRREELAQILLEPIGAIAQKLSPLWNQQSEIEDLLLREFSSIPHCTSLYVLDTKCTQLCNNIGRTGLESGHYGRDRSQRPYMKEAIPNWGFLLSDAYISKTTNRPSLTAIQIIRTENEELGYLGADFDLCDLPVTSELYHEPKNWRQVKGDPAIRSQLFQQTRVDSLMDDNMEQAIAILDEMITQRGVFQAQIHFSSSQATIWMKSDPFRYRILDMEALTDPDICLVYPREPYPSDALIPPECIVEILGTFQDLRTADENIYLRLASINIFTGMISVTFSCDGSHYMNYHEFISKGIQFWLGSEAVCSVIQQEAAANKASVRI